ncbi:MAG: cyclic nucleotide-binding domain-containing protein [Alphaproteobacteria bacterium]|nr:cyclic nucleotide-binding domain-containing protein [Alphaproteobacteria bacterium]
MSDRMAKHRENAPRQLANLLKSYKGVAFVEGQRIFTEGEPAECMYVVRSGEVDVLFRGKLLETVTPPGIFGEMGLIDGAPRSADAVARTDCELVRVEEIEFLRMVERVPYLALNVMQLLVDRIKQMNERLGAAGL